MTALPWLLDVDGVCTDFVAGLYRALGTGRVAESCARYDLFADLDAAESVEAYRILATHDFWHTLEPIEGMQRGLEKIRAAGFEVVFVTSPWHSCPSWLDARVRWLRSHCSACGSWEVIATARKNLVQGAAFVDDRPANVSGWASAQRSPHGYVYAQTYNTEAPGRRITWDDIDEVIAAVLEDRNADT